MTIALALLLFTAAPMEPAEQSSTRMVSRTARQHFAQGATSYKLGRFDQALESFARAYELEPLPGFLFNIAQCHYQLENFESAVFFYEGYLDASPDVPNRVAIEDRIREASQRWKAQRAKQAETEDAANRRAEEEEAAQQAEDAARRAEAAAERTRVALERAASARAPATDENQPESEGTSVVWYWTLGGVGAAVVAGVLTALTLAVGGSTFWVLSTQSPLESPKEDGTLGTVDRRSATP